MMVLLVLGLAAPAQAQTTWYVDDDAPGDPGPGDPNVSDPDEDGSPERPFDTIQAAIDAAHDGDIVWLWDGGYAGPGNRDLDFHGKAIAVCSVSGNPKACIIDCQGTAPDPHRGFYFHSGEAETSVLAGLTVTNGYTNWYGGGVCCEYSSPTLTNCMISGNQAAFGAGVACRYSSNPKLTNCTISDNSVFWAHGGGVYGHENSNPTLTNCTISGNSAPLYGGGVCGQYASPTLTNCTISGNLAGGAPSGYGCGGGVAWQDNCSPTLTNCTISGNSADFDGGGVYCEPSSSPTLTNCTISGNSAGAIGGGVCCYQLSNATLTNCILWDDTPQEMVGSPVVTYCDVQGGWSGTGNIDADPLFVDAAAGDYHLGPGSPCIDAGCNGGVPRDFADLDEDGNTNEITPFDLDGEGRFFDDPNTPDTGCGCPPIVDMGAYEFGDTGPQPCPGDLDGDRDVDHSDLGILLSLWGATDECDLDCDGDIDHADLGILLAHWGEGCP